MYAAWMGKQWAKGGCLNAGRDPTRRAKHGRFEAKGSGYMPSDQEVILSADSHVMEPHDLWVERLPSAYREQAPRFAPPKVGEGFQRHPGGHDPHERIKEMAADGVSAEVLYPTLGLRLFGLDDPGLQEACFRRL